MPDQPSTADIRQFLYKFFNDEELTTLSSDYFGDLSENFTVGMTKQQKISLLLEYCQHREIIPNLLAAIQRERPEQYKERFPQAPKAEARPEPAKPIRDPKQVFISHAHEDADFAHRLANDLQQNGWRVWIAPDNIRPGEMWGEGIDRGIDESGVLVLVLTQRSVQSPWVRKETYVAIQLESQGRIKFIPLEVEPCDVPGLWSTYQRVSFQSDYGSGLTALLDALEPERHSRREREAQEKATREEAEQLERELEERRKAAQAEAERQARLAAEKAEAERLAQESREREAQEKARREETERQAKLAAEQAEAVRVERERNDREARLQAAREAERQARLKAIPSQSEPVAEPQTAHVPQPTRWTRPHLPRWALPVAGSVLVVLVLTVIAWLVGSTIHDNAAATQTAVAILTATPFPIVTRIVEQDGMVMVYVPAGEFLMGSSDLDKQARSNEKPQHKVYLDAFWMDQTEVTNAQYKKCVQEIKCKGSSNANDSEFNGDNQPVVGVDWNDAKSYCEWAGRRLPTEAEWEKAARGPDGRLYPWGNTAPDSNRLNFNLVDRATEVGKYPTGASPYGALDMAGNVREWTSSLSKPYPYKADDGREDMSSSDPRVLRGGSFDISGLYARAACRSTDGPGSVWSSYGFRCGVSVAFPISLK